MTSKPRVTYYFDNEIGIYQYSYSHPMKPLRVAITDRIVQSYGLYSKMKIYDASFINVTDEDLKVFHVDEYIDLIKNVNPDNKNMYEDELFRFNFGDDCPVFPNLYEYCLLYSTGSILGAQLINEGKSDIAINWSGGLHHAKKCEASGFCYINDCVLAILELLKKYQKVLYIDIDVHHGDGVEEAFYTSNRVMTASFHKFGDFFPGTGHINDNGLEDGTYHSVNFPLKDGMDDFSYEIVFKKVIGEIMNTFRPDAIVLQCGSDSLSGDRLGCFNLSVKGHGEAVNFCKSLGVPLMLLGGGGYTLRNVPRAWTYETSIALGVDVPNELPEMEFMEYFGPEYKLHFPVSNMENMNTKEELENYTKIILENLKKIDSSGVHISNYKDNGGEKFDFGDMMKAQKDKIEVELQDSHVTKQTVNYL